MCEWNRESSSLLPFGDSASFSYLRNHKSGYSMNVQKVIVTIVVLASVAAAVWMAVKNIRGSFGGKNPCAGCSTPCELKELKNRAKMKQIKEKNCLKEKIVR